MTETDLVVRQRHKDSIDTAKLFSRQDLIPERDLHTRKWFDYRFMSPKEATYVFHEEYQKVYRRKYARTFDTAEAERKFGVRAGIPSQQRGEFTSFWRARQLADLLGTPYSVFLEAAFETLLSDGFHRMPYINQLYGKHSERIAVAAIDLWQEHCESRLMFSALPHYREESFFGLSAQIAHRNWVLEQLKGRSDMAIGRACFIARVLPVERAAAEFGSDQMERAREAVADEMPVEVDGYVKRQLLPSCVMLPGVTDGSSPECSTCKLSASCDNAGRLVIRSVTESTGVADPVEDRRRRQQRDRTRKHRQKIKLAAEATASVESERLATAGIASVAM